MISIAEKPKLQNKFAFKSLGEIYDPKNNAFDIFRLFFAASVIYFHAFPLYWGSGTIHVDVVTIFFKGNEVLGGLAVNSFFIISGFLIAQSYLSSKSIFNYFINRLLRIFPALFASITLAAFAIGPFFTNLSLNTYFSLNTTNNPFFYTFHNLTFYIFYPVNRLAGVFANNPQQFSVNGSVWTLKLEFALYLLLPVILYLFKIKNKKRYLLLIYFVFLALTLLSFFKIFNPVINFWFLRYEYTQFIKLSSYFLSGTLIYIYKDKIKINWLIISVLIVLLLFLNSLGQIQFAELFLLPILIIGLGIILKNINIKKFGDISYGMYIYAFPIQQVLAMKGLSFVGFVILSYLITIIISFFSWKLIEKPALTFKKPVADFIVSKLTMIRKTVKI